MEEDVFKPGDLVRLDSESFTPKAVEHAGIGLVIKVERDPEGPPYRCFVSWPRRETNKSFYVYSDWLVNVDEPEGE